MCHWHEETKKGIRQPNVLAPHLGRQGEMKGGNSSVVGSAHRKLKNVTIDDSYPI